MAQQQTSLLAYSELRDKLPERQKQVLDCISVFGPMNNKQISERLRLPINCITGRVLELRRKQLVRLERTDVDQTGRRQMYWSAV